MKKLLITLTLMISTGCAIEHRHAGEVTVKLDLDALTEIITPICLRELGLEQYELDELTDQEFWEVEQCVNNKIDDLLALTETEEELEEAVNEMIEGEQQ